MGSGEGLLGSFPSPFSPSSAASPSPSAAPTLWDDLLLVVAWLKAVGDADVDDGARALARAMLGNAILREVVLGPLEAAEGVVEG